MKYQINIILLNETQVKCTLKNIDKMLQRMKSIGREAAIFAADSEQSNLAKNIYLLGGLMSIFQGKIRLLINEKVERGPLGNWMAIKLQYNIRTLAIINLYYLPTTSPNGNVCSLTQYNLKEGKAKSTNKYRKEIFAQIKSYLARNDDISDLIIAEDFNQSVALKEVQQFFS